MARSGSDEFYTPEILWRPALEAWGLPYYDIDPASNSESNPNVKAHWTYTIEDDGLAPEHDWRKSKKEPARLLWCNPPFSRMTDFVEKLLSELELGNVHHAIFLAKCDCRTQWFKRLSENCNAALFVHQSIQFIGAENGSFFGVCLFYFGDEPGLFYRAYAHLGTVMQAMVPGQFGE